MISLQVYVERRFLSATISGTGSITGVVKNLIVALWVLISLITTFFIWNGDVTSSAVILGGILVGLSWLTSASPGGFHDWKTLYQDRHRFYMWLHTYIVEANLVYCSPTVPLLEIKDNAAEIYKKRQ